MIYATGHSLGRGQAGSPHVRSTQNLASPRGFVLTCDIGFIGSADISGIARTLRCRAALAVAAIVATRSDIARLRPVKAQRLFLGRWELNWIACAAGSLYKPV